MLNLANSSVMVSGSFFKSAVETLKEFNHLGQKVLAKHNIDSIDGSVFYPNQLRVDLFQAVYERFGDAGLTWVGWQSPRQFVSMEDLHQYPTWLRLSAIKFDEALRTNPVALDQFFQNYL